MAAFGAGVVIDTTARLSCGAAGFAIFFGPGAVRDGQAGAACHCGFTGAGGVATTTGGGVEAVWLGEGCGAGSGLAASDEILLTARS